MVDFVKHNPSPTKVVVVGMAWPPETFLARLARGLADSGLRVTLAVGHNPGNEWLSHANIDWLFTPGWDGTSYVRRLAQLGSMAATGALRSTKDLRTFAPHVRGGAAARLRAWHRLLPFAGRRWDVIYFPWNSAAIEHLALFALDIPIVLSCRGAQVSVAPHNPERIAIRDGLRATFEKAAAVHCVSEAIKLEAMQFGLRDEKAHVIHPAIDPGSFHPYENPRQVDDGYRLITTGSLIWRKGYEYALQAIRALKDKGAPVQYTIIGDGPERARLLYTIQDLGLEGDVCLLGQVPPEQVRDLLQGADVFLLASLSEGISNAALEAMACGLPVVTTACGGMREAITDGVEGLVVPPRDPFAMAQALHELWIQSDLRVRMGNAGRERILREFTLEQQIERFRGLLSSAASPIAEQR